MSSTSSDFSGLWIPLITPFRDGVVDHAALQRLAKHLRAQGVAGFVVCGSTGEAAALDEAEQLAVLDTVLDATPRLPVVMGASGYHLGKMQAWVRTLASRPLAGLLMPAPGYIRPSQAGLIDWFRALADASPAPLIIYDIPYRTGAVVQRETLLALAGHPNIRAIKDCGGDTAKTLALIADGRLQVLAGEDLQIFGTVAQGGVGAIAASAHLRTAQFAAVLGALAQGELERARAAWLPLVPLIEALFAEANPAPLKAVLASQGWLCDELRAPMTLATAPLRERLQALAVSRP